MKFKISLFFTAILVCMSTSVFGEESSGKHLFILSGQSNMRLLDPEVSFIPDIEHSLGKDNVIFIKTAHSGYPIRRWYKNWRASDGGLINFRGPRREMLRENWRVVQRLYKQFIQGERLNPNGEYYEEIMGLVDKARINVDLPFVSVTFVWMHGERDAREGYGDVYERSLEGLHQQFKDDFDRTDVNFVLGRISDWDMTNHKYPAWTEVRKAQVRFAERFSNVLWVDTDDLNTGLASTGAIYDDGLHYSIAGYRLLGERFARAALQLITKNSGAEH